jgi:hypothetical protein
MAAARRSAGHEEQAHVRKGVPQIGYPHTGIATPELLYGDVEVDDSGQGDERATHIGKCR